MRNVVLAAAALGLAGQGFAQETVKATKTSPVVEAVNNSYASIEVRHDYASDATRDEEEPRLYLIPKLGTKILNGKIDSFLRYYTYNRTNSAVTEKRYLRWTTLVSAYSTEFANGMSLSWDPFTDARYRPDDNNLFEVHGSATVGLAKVPTVLGEVKLAAEFDPYTTFYNKAQKSDDYSYDQRLKERGISLADGNDPETGEPIVLRNDPVYETDYYLRLYFAPAGLPKLNFEAYTALYREYHPSYSVVQDENGQASQELRGYRATNSIENLLKVNYAMTDNLTLADELYVRQDGFYEARSTLPNALGGAVENQVRVIYGF